MDSNHRSRHERAGFCCGRRIAGPSAGSQKGLFFLRYRWFESISLQRRVSCEPVLLRLGCKKFANRDGVMRPEFLKGPAPEDGAAAATAGEDRGADRAEGRRRVF